MVARPRLSRALLAAGLAAAVAAALTGAAAAASATEVSSGAGTGTASVPSATSVPRVSIRDADQTTILGWASHDLTTMASEEQAFGTTNAMLSTYVDFVQSPSFPDDDADAASARGSALLIAWEPWDWSRPADQ